MRHTSLSPMYKLFSFVCFFSVYLIVFGFVLLLIVLGDGYECLCAVGDWYCFFASEFLVCCFYGLLLVISVLNWLVGYLVLLWFLLGGLSFVCFIYAGFIFGGNNGLLWKLCDFDWYVYFVLCFYLVVGVWLLCLFVEVGVALFEFDVCVLIGVDWLLIWVLLDLGETVFYCLFGIACAGCWTVNLTWF